MERVTNVYNPYPTITKSHVVIINKNNLVLELVLGFISRNLTEFLEFNSSMNHIQKRFY